ncbi:MAG TPA: 2-amino-4-hydroxy-6-hydroxymethyldihydropteridine diphosphokinase [Woeseiaceae bacterium]
MSMTHWYPAYVGVGSNLDNPAMQVEEAMSLLDKLPGTRLVTRSALYRSAPFGGVEQPWFVNAVAALLTTLEPLALLEQLQALERRQGRDMDGVRWGPRVLDLDLLVYSDRSVEESRLTVPHPGIAGRNFVLLPLGEIAPQLVIPGLGRVSGIPVDSDQPAISRIE